jgi:WD40 repeat protein
MYKTALLVVQTFILILLPIFTSAQECQPPKIVFNDNAGNIFSEEQEMYLGEAIAQQVQKNFRVIGDQEVNEYVRRIGNRIAGNLPPTKIKFQFFVVDVPEVNAFAFAGGRIYVTRKLIAFVRNEDELAGVIAHELGHAIVRHSAVDMSRNFREILGVKTVGGREDVFAKYNDFIDKWNTKKIKTKNSHAGKQQVEADRIGVFAMNAAGYDPNAFTSAFDRIAETEGKTGSWFSDLFGTTSAGEKRLREIIKAVELIPASCIDQKNAGSSAGFESWRTHVIGFSDFSGNEKITGLIRRQSLDPALRDDINHLEFSPDGKHIIAQDDSGIFVLRSDPFELLFRIDSPEANQASFTPDSQSIVFNTPTLRVERWSIAGQKPAFIREMFVRNDCFQTALSRMGNYFVCFSFDRTSRGLHVDLTMFDVRTNEPIYEKKKFFQPHFLDYYQYTLRSAVDDETRMFQVEFSPDGRYFVAGRVFKNQAKRQVSSLGGFTITRDVKAGKAGILGFDLIARKEIKIDEKLRDIIISPFAFLSGERIVGQNDENEEESGIFAFPSGERIEKFTIKGDSLTTTPKGKYVLVRPIKTAPVGLYDLERKEIVIANKTPAFAVYENKFVSESKAGELGLYNLGDDRQLGLIDLPVSRFGNIRTLNVSPDLNWLAVSDKNRGAVWSLYSGKRYFLVRGFSEAFFDADGKIYSDFAKSDETARQVAVMDLKTRTLTSSEEMKSANVTQYGPYLIGVKPLDEAARKKNPNKRRVISRSIGSSSFIEILSYSVEPTGTLEVRDVRSRNLLWSKTFTEGMPRRFISPVNDTITLVWSLESEAVKEIIEEDEKLKKMAAAMGEKDGDHFVQVVEAGTGKIIGQTMIETGERSFRVNRAEASGKWLTIVDSENRVQFYSLADGELKHRFFGSNFAINPQNNTAAVGNLTGQIAIYSLDSGRTLENMSFDSPIAYARYDKYGGKLFVLTTKQEVFILDAAEFSGGDDIADN